MTNRPGTTPQTALSFEHFAYRRPDIKALQKKTEQLIQKMQDAASGAEQVRILRRFNRLFMEFRTMANLCYVRHTQNTADPFYEAENSFFDEQMPEFEALTNKLSQALLESPFRDDIAARLGQQIFTIASLSRQVFSPEIIGELQQENALSSEYTRTKALARIEFEGQSYNLSSIYPLELSDDRTMRRRAAAAKWSFFQTNQEKIEQLFDNLVQKRHAIAQKLGASTFTAIGYARMGRSDYNPEMVTQFRNEVAKWIVPLASELYERQRIRLGLDKLRYYDEEFRFKTGNPKPLGQPSEIIDHAAFMYRELSEETRLFFERMQAGNLMDLVNRDGKATGGYCTYISQYQAPFIFSNFNGTSADVDVLTHEAGHAFQVWMSRSLPLEDYYWPTSDAAEIHSMSMEFFTRPWMHRFFGKQEAVKYDFMHLVSAIQFIPYGVAVDEFQHLVYDHPSWTPAQRNEAWRSLEARYLPHRDYHDNEFLIAGCFWQKQSHIFNSPFYYIDYTLAQICAFQFWIKDRRNHTRAWRDYVRLCKAGGSKSFLELVRLAGLRSPFETGIVEEIAATLRAHLEGIDDASF